ncbi:MAG: AsmA family protein [Legionellales bacterium]|nr:AsmA family protein [Legionellales bacterium]
MKTILKLLGITLTLIVVLFITAAVLVYHYINADQIKKFLSDQIYARTGRHLTIQGKMDWSFFPWLGIKIPQVDLENAKNFAPANFAAIKEVDVKFKLLPLFTGKIAIGNIKIIGLQLNLAKNAQGITNWDDILNYLPTRNPRGNTAALSSTNQSSSSKTISLSAIAAKYPVNIAGIDIQDAAVTWNDQSQHKTLQINHFNFKSSDIAFNQSIPVALDLDLLSSNPSINGHMRLSSTINLNTVSNRITANNVSLDTKLNSKLFTSGNFTGEITGDALIDFNQQTLQINPLTLQTSHANADFTVQGTDILNQFKLQGTFNLHDMNIREVFNDIGQRISLVNSSALTHANATGQYYADRASISINKLQAKVDDTSITGELRVNLQKPLNYVVNLTADQLDLDQYSLKTASGVKNNATPTISPTVSSRASSSEVLPINLLRQLNGKINLAIAKLMVNKKLLNDLQMNVSANQGLITVNNSRAKLYQGQYQGTGSLDVRSAQPQLAFKGDLADLNIQDFLQFKKNSLGVKSISGKGQAQWNLTATGNNQNAWLNSLTGTMRIRFDNGQINGIDLGYQLSHVINEVFAKINKTSPVKAQDNTGNTRFVDIILNNQFNQGIANSQFNLDGPILNLNAKGDVNLPLQRFVNMRVIAHLNSEQHGGQGYKQIAQIPLAFDVNGAFLSPRVQPDMNYMVQVALKLYEQKLIDKTKNNITQKVDQLIQKKLGGGDNQKLNNLLKNF